MKQSTSYKNTELLSLLSNIICSVSDKSISKLKEEKFSELRDENGSIDVDKMIRLAESLVVTLTRQKFDV